MKKHWLGGLLLGVSLALLLAGGVALADEVGPSQEWDEATMPPVPTGLANTHIDNEDNAHSGNPDDDMGLGTGVNQCLFMEDRIHPIEFRISSPGGPAELTIAAWDVDEAEEDYPDELVRVRFNGEQVGNLTVGPSNTWTVTTFSVTATGNDLVVAEQITTREPGCFGIAWGALQMGGEFVPEPGTLMLLGGGLAGLAGYATLRLRSGQALRWRTRE